MFVTYYNRPYKVSKVSKHSTVFLKDLEGNQDYTMSVNEFDELMKQRVFRLSPGSDYSDYPQDFLPEYGNISFNEPKKIKKSIEDKISDLEEDYVPSFYACIVSSDLTNKEKYSLLVQYKDYQTDIFDHFCRSLEIYDARTFHYLIIDNKIEHIHSLCETILSLCTRLSGINHDDIYEFDLNYFINKSNSTTLFDYSVIEDILDILLVNKITYQDLSNFYGIYDDGDIYDFFDLLRTNTSLVVRHLSEIQLFDDYHSELMELGYSTNDLYMYFKYTGHEKEDYKKLCRINYDFKKIINLGLTCEEIKVFLKFFCNNTDLLEHTDKIDKDVLIFIKRYTNRYNKNYTRNIDLSNDDTLHSPVSTMRQIEYKDDDDIWY